MVSHIIVCITHYAKINEGNENNANKSNSSINSNNSNNSKNGNKIPKMIVGIKKVTKMRISIWWIGIKNNPSAVIKAQFEFGLKFIEKLDAMKNNTNILGAIIVKAQYLLEMEPIKKVAQKHEQTKKKRNERKNRQKTFGKILQTLQRRKISKQIDNMLLGSANTQKSNLYIMIMSNYVEMLWVVCEKNVITYWRGVITSQENVMLWHLDEIGVTTKMPYQSAGYVKVKLIAVPLKRILKEFRISVVLWLNTVCKLVFVKRVHESNLNKYDYILTERKVTMNGHEKS